MKSYQNGPPRDRHKDRWPPPKTSTADPPVRYIRHTLEVRESPAWAGLPPNARRVLDALEVTLMRRGFPKDGEIVLTYDQLERTGIRRSSIRRAIEQASALGFVEIVRRGYMARSDVHVASVYRLTYIKGLQWSALPTDEWRRFRSKREVDLALRKVDADLETERETRRAGRCQQPTHRGISEG